MATTPEEIEEERRLLHVAMTRAKDGLDLIVPQRFFLYRQNQQDHRHAYAAITRFIPKSIQHVFERRHRTERPSGPTARKSRSHSRIDVTAGVGRMWR
jgi:DNA helicase-2/ATP-dependent DNA helicase PcrA